MRIWMLLSLSFAFSMSSAAWASKARLRALGQSENGSLFIEDNRNIFLNPAIVRSLRNSAYIELGEHSTNLNTSTGQSPKAEGGLVYELEQVTLAAQLGRLSDSIGSIATFTSDWTNVLLPENSFELIVGGGANISWGGSLFYANSSADRGADEFFPDREASAMSLRGGVASHLWQAFVNLDLRHQAEIRNQVSNQKYDGNLSVDLGGSYSFSETFAVGLTVTQRSADFNNAGQSGDMKLNRYELEAFHFFRKTEKLQVFASAGLLSSQMRTRLQAPGVPDQELNSLTMPVTLGFETSVKEWLALRGSVRQGVLLARRNLRDGTNDLDQRNMPISAIDPGESGIVASAGASFMFEGLQVDAVLQGAENRSGLVDGNNLFGRVSLAYLF